MIRVVNLRDYAPVTNEVLIKVDRSSIVGNPFYMKDESQRNKVCDEYEIYFKSKMLNSLPFQAFVKNIKNVSKESDVALGCWCHPKRCHADTIKNYIRSNSQI